MESKPSYLCRYGCGTTRTFLGNMESHEAECGSRSVAPPPDSLEKWAAETYEALQFLYRDPETHSLNAEGLESLLARARALGVRRE